VGVVVFVFGYTGFGGAFAHAYTNGMQALIMLVVSTLVFMSGLSYWFDGSVVATLADDGWTAPGSVLFSTPLEVWGVPFLMGAALSTQPHLLTKALYVDGRRDLALTVGVGLGAFTVFQLMLFAGTYALLALPEPVPQDQVVAQYLVVAFESQPLLGAFCTVAILSASMSTLDGLLVWPSPRPSATTCSPRAPACGPSAASWRPSPPSRSPSRGLRRAWCSCSVRQASTASSRRPRGPWWWA
jgi:Na+/pantothenate symporter